MKLVVLGCAVGSKCAFAGVCMEHGPGFVWCLEERKMHAGE